VSTISLQNSLPLSETISNDRPCLHNHLENRADATETALLSGIATNSAYFEIASVTQRMNIFPEGKVFKGLNKFM
jgi:hypothetical protein